MKAIVLLAVLVVMTIAGCPSTTPNANENDNTSAAANENVAPALNENQSAADARLMITDALRAACPLSPDSAVIQLLATVEQNRLTDYPLAQAAADVLAGCDLAQQGLGLPACYTCALAGFDQVYAGDPELAAVLAMPRPNFDGKWMLMYDAGVPAACVEIFADMIIAWDTGCALAELDRTHDQVIADLTQTVEDARDACLERARGVPVLIQTCHDSYERDLNEALTTSEANHGLARLPFLMSVSSQPFVFSHGVAAWGFTVASASGVAMHSLLIIAGTDPPSGYFDGIPVTLIP